MSGQENGSKADLHKAGNERRNRRFQSPGMYEMKGFPKEKLDFQTPLAADEKSGNVQQRGKALKGIWHQQSSVICWANHRK
ncbi:hypothetical protein OQZ33_21750 [Pedobacter sp. MC2016-05]|uniref:hypothetical protein n=1 Tax=Pedobacter sp. MC2016-05 TaxID=2994474 RepID=UPI002245DC1D|nr:hypothetical protein [Pedobacter sp. MC2016-05]MCX2476973.1 hypothetical protein [Pedobacter sp. MC2016-05]